ncbi:MAG: formate--phosphoribosylaminoimidazolecarboxamide ligase, partial [Candidatus Micrarchaeota archaeon]
KKKIDSILSEYNSKKLSIATLCSHSSLQIFYNAKKEKLHTIGICTNPQQKKMYEAFPNAAPDELIEIDSPHDIATDELVSKNALIVPHGSFVEYFGKGLDDFEVPVFGNRKSLMFERDRRKMYDWMRKAGLRVPAVFNPEKIDRACVVKHAGAKGGHGYAIVHSSEEFHEKFPDATEVMIQEYLTGVRVYPHYFYSPLSKEGFRASEGHLELLSMDRRFESNIDESYRTMMAGVPIKPSFTVVGNEPIVLRESLLADVLDMGKSVVEAADKLFGGMPWPFCLELIIDEDLQFSAFEISARIVAGTNIYPKGSPYSLYAHDEAMSTARRIAVEAKEAAKKKKLAKVCY